MSDTGSGSSPITPAGELIAAAGMQCVERGSSDPVFCCRSVSVGVSLEAKVAAPAPSQLPPPVCAGDDRMQLTGCTDMKLTNWW